MDNYHHNYWSDTAGSDDTFILYSLLCFKKHMNYFGGMLFGLVLLIPVIAKSQHGDSLISNEDSGIQKRIRGFIRGGVYTGRDHEGNNNPYVSSAFSDIAIKAEVANGLNFKAFADLRFRYGAEFQEPVNRLDFREGYIKLYGKRWDLSAGQEIVKWGRADFTNPTSKLNPQNLILRSPDRDDMDIGNLLSSVNWYPSEHIKLEAVVIPFYKSSVLIIDPIKLPENVKINQINSLITGKEMLSYGLKADFHLKGIDLGLSWFDGYDPMPGIAMTKFNFDLTGPVPLAYTELSMTPYRTRVSGMDFETSSGSFGIRGEAAWSIPDLSNKVHEYVPWPDIKWVTGMDWSSGIWRITGEYSGKNIPEFTAALVDPVIGSEPDYALFAQLLATPGFDLEEYVRQQVGVFNRLYNYQLKRYYHSGGIRIEAELAYGKLTPSLFTMYNFTSRDLLIIPEIRYKPTDGLTITAGGEFYSGRKGSLYDIIDGFMNSIYVVLKADF